jgi:uncharacterized membrane protein
MLMTALALVFVLMSGVLAGVLVGVELAVVPMLAALPADRYVQVHRLLDPGFDPFMPRFNQVALGIGVLITIFAPGVPAKLVFATAVLCIVGVAVVSEVYNVRLNRRIDTWESTTPPADWQAVRLRWGRWNRVRTAISVLGFLVAVAGNVMIS